MQRNQLNIPVQGANDKMRMSLRTIHMMSEYKSYPMTRCAIPITGREEESRWPWVLHEVRSCSKDRWAHAWGLFEGEGMDLELRHLNHVFLLS